MVMRKVAVLMPNSYGSAFPFFSGSEVVCAAELGQVFCMTAAPPPSRPPVLIIDTVLQATASCRRLLPPGGTRVTIPCVPSVAAPTTSSCAQVDAQAAGHTLYIFNTCNVVLLQALPAAI